MSEAVSNLVSGLPAGSAHVTGSWLAALLTVAILSFAVGDNGLFRLAEHLFIGVAAGYAGGLVWNMALWPRLELLLGDPGQYWYYGVFFVLGLLLLARGVRPLSGLADLPLALMFGTGAALALGGAVSGTLVPQIRASIISLSPSDYGQGVAGWTQAIDAALLLLGTLTVLSAFHFTRQTPGAPGNPGLAVLLGMGQVGRKVLMIALGALFAGALLTFFTILTSRLHFLIYDWGALLGNMGF